MLRLVRILLVATGSLVLLAALGVALAWFLMPRDWIDREARRQAAQIRGATVRWGRLSPGFLGFSLGVRIDGLYIRVPGEREGEARFETHVRDLFVSFRLLPLLSRRVEISAARVRGGGIAMTDRGTTDTPRGGASPAADLGVAFVLPRLDFEGIDFSSRDAYGGGIDVRRLSGHSELDGSIDHPRAIRFDARAESLFWKPSSSEAMVSLPGPLRIDFAAEARAGGTRVVITRGIGTLGPLESRIEGDVRMPVSAGKPAVLDLVVSGTRQSIRSTDEAFRSIAKRTSAAWTTTASWELRVAGAVTAPIQTGRLVLKPLAISAGSNQFTLDQVVATWNALADRSYTARVEGAGSGVRVMLEAGGSTSPGGASKGMLLLNAPAARLNGIVPNAPTWISGELECRARFSIRPPASPVIQWTITGTGLNGTIPGLKRPVSGLRFDVEGDERAVSIHSFGATVGSTTASFAGSMLLGKPLGTGTFRAHLDRLVIEEWAPPPSPNGAGGTGIAATPGPPPIPLRSFEASVTIGELRSGSMTLRDVVVPLRFADGNLTAAPLHGAIGTGTLSGDIYLKNLTAAPSYSLVLDVKRAPVQEVLGGVIPLDLGFTGLASGSIRLAGPGFPGAALENSLQGVLSGTVEDGMILETPTIAGLRSALGLESGSGSSEGVAFRTLTHSLRIQAGRLLFDSVKGDIGNDVYQMTGSMGFDRSLDLDLLLKLAPGRFAGGGTLATLARYASDKDGRLPVNVKVTGTAMAPKFSVNPTRTLDPARLRLQDQLRKELAAAVRGDTTGTDSVSAGDPLRKGREALRRLLGK